jgi:hypothetical protein
MQFTAADVEFIVFALGRDLDGKDCLVDLLSDPDSRDTILDDVRLFRALLEQMGCVQVSSRLYFYVLVRHVMLEAGLDDHRVADYIAEVLSVFVSEHRRRNPFEDGNQPMHYVVDMLAALQRASHTDRFIIRAHLGNFTLFLSGLFPQHVRHRRERRAAPGIDYYEQIGRDSYCVAGNHRLADQYELAPVFQTLSTQFRATRLALNELSDRLVSLEDSGLENNALILGDS